MDLGASRHSIAPPFARLFPSTKWVSSRCVLHISSGVSYSLLSRLRDVLVGFEERSDVHRLASPLISVNRPVEGELEGAFVEDAWIDQYSWLLLVVLLSLTGHAAVRPSRKM